MIDKTSKQNLVDPITNNTSMAELDMTTPFALAACQPVIHKFCSNKVVQERMTWFGSHYKRQSQFAIENKYTGILTPKCGKEQADGLFTELFNVLKNKPLDITSVAPSFNCTTWLVGYAADYQFAGLLPNSAGMFKLMWKGSEDLYAFSLSQIEPLIMHMFDVPQEEITVDIIKEKLTNATEEVLAQLVDSGLQPYHIKLGEGMMCFVPVGWFVLEHTSGGASIFGMRKSVFFKDGQGSSHKEYCLAKKMLATAKHSVAKMEEVIAIFEK